MTYTRLSVEAQQDFHQAVNLAQAGEKSAAYLILTALCEQHPATADLLLWLAFTTPNLHEARQAIRQVGELEPANSMLENARRWLNQAEAARPNSTTEIAGRLPDQEDAAR